MRIAGRVEMRKGIMVMLGDGIYSQITLVEFIIKSSAEYFMKI